MYSRLQWGDRRFYLWLRQIGLAPAKSLTLGPLSVPDTYFADFFRDCVDGDGSVLVYTDRYHVRENPHYVYERLYVSLVSASRVFLEWITRTVSRLTGVNRPVTIKLPGRHPLYVLCYAKGDSSCLLEWMYYARDVPCLKRKRLAAEGFLSNEKPRTLRLGAWRSWQPRGAQNAVPERA